MPIAKTISRRVGTTAVDRPERFDKKHLAEDPVETHNNLVQVLGIDAGGTMTDTFFVRGDGRFVVGKSQSNPADELLAIYNSSVDALAHWGRNVDDVYPELVTCVYSGTAMLNRILMRKGLDVGLICNRGFEQIHSMGRALQSYLGYALEDRIHLNTHRYDAPLVPVSRTRGVTERTDVQGRIVIPLREEEVRQAIRDLVEADAQAIVICLLQSHKNEASEKRARDVAIEELKLIGSEIPVFASVDYYPSRKESHRMNTTILEAYGAEPSRQTLKLVNDRFKKHGAKFDLRVMATHGGTISWRAKELARTIVSGPIGGVIGAKLLGEALGDENIACSDIGGTSFDVALITKGNFAIKSDPDMARLVLSLPLVAMDSVGAGAGSFVRLDPYSKSIKLGPDSAGYRVGTCWPESGLDTVSVSDCHVVLGYLNPNNFLGGADKARRRARPPAHQGADRRSARLVDRRCGRRSDRASGRHPVGILARQHQREGLQPGGIHLLFLWWGRPRPHLRLYRRRRLQGRRRSGMGRRFLGLWLRLRGLRIPLR